MNDIRIFQNPAFGSVRTLTENGATLFCGVDIATPLGYAKPHNAIAAHCPHALKRGIGVRTGTKADGSPAIQQVEMTFITEGDVYRLIARSKLPAAEAFERWIFDEVLPSIRKHGAYLTPETLEAALLNPDTLIRLATELKAERAQRQALQAQIEADAPKVMWATVAEGSERGTLIREFCKYLRPFGVEIGEKRMFADMRDGGWLVKAEGRDRNTPTQKAVDMGLFTVRETAIAKPDGTTVTRTTPLLTEKGKQYFAKRYLSGKGAEASP